MMKRPLAVISGAFVCGIIAALLDFNIFFILALFILGLLAGFFIDRKIVFGFLIVLSFALLGVARINASKISLNNTVNTLSGTCATVRMTAADFSDGPNTVALFKTENKTYKVYLNIKDEPRLLPGDIIKGEFSFRAPSSDKVSINGFSSYLSSQGIYITAYADSVKVLSTQRGSFSGWIFSIRRYVNNLGEIYLSKNTRALFNAMVLGDKSLISPELSQSLRICGISHIAVVSGMHLSIVISVLMCIITQLFGKYRWGYLIGIFTSVIITLVTGAGVSVVRALITSLLFCISRILYRETDSVTSLSFAVLVMTVINPFVIMNVGFILSVASVAGIVLFYPGTSIIVKKVLPGNIGDIISLSLSAQIIVTPVLIYFFTTLSLYSILANVLVSFFASGLVICGIIFCFVASIPLLSDITAFMIEFFSVATEVVCQRILTLPYAELEIHSHQGAFITLWIILLLVLFSLRKKSINLKKSVCLLVTIAVLTSSFIYKKQSTDVYFYTYGENSMAAIFTPRTSVLLDCPDRYDAKTLSQSKSFDTYDYAILTGKNQAEMIDFAKQGGVKKVFAYAPFFTEDFIKETAAQLRKKGIHIEFLDKAKLIYCDGFTIEYIPLENAGNETVAAKIKYNNKSFVTLQGLSAKTINSLFENENKINCDYLFLPFKAYSKNFNPERLCSGKIISAEKIYHERNKKTVKFHQ